MTEMYDISCVCPETVPGMVAKNMEKIRDAYLNADPYVGILLTPELSLTGASCGDLVHLESIQEAVVTALTLLADATSTRNTILVVGCPMMYQGRLYNTAAMLCNGAVKAFVAKQTVDSRFTSGTLLPKAAWMDSISAPLYGTQVFTAYMPAPGRARPRLLRFGIEIGTDRDMLRPPALDMVAAGATLILNPAADPVLYGNGTADMTYRSQELATRYGCMYAIAGAGDTESTGSYVYSGVLSIALPGTHHLMRESSQPMTCADVCKSSPARQVTMTLVPGMLQYYRRQHCRYEFRAENIEISTQVHICGHRGGSLQHLPVIAHPYSYGAFEYEDLFDLQCRALLGRVRAIGTKTLVLGVSGGLDSTLALLVCVQVAKAVWGDVSHVCAVTMPGPGTGDRTRGNAEKLCELLGVPLMHIPIGPAVQQHLKDIGHSPDCHDITYENCQARERTQILMDLANKLQGIVVGTGDLSELALGWCTYNGDQMSMYSVNASLPKTLVRSIVMQYAVHSGPDLHEVLCDILETPVSPELLPGMQATEQLIGSYELHDFFLYYMLVWGCGEELLALLARKAFVRDGKYTQEAVNAALLRFRQRFLRSQFKRSCSPDGAQLIEMSLHPVTGWKMPADLQLNYL